MDLIAKALIIALIVVVVVLIAFALKKIARPVSSAITEQQAEEIVLKDAVINRTNATISIINASHSQLVNGSWDIILSVAYNGTKPCPTLLLEGFDYPATGLVAAVDILYTKNCKIYGLPSNSSQYYNYVVSSPYVAIAESYNQSYAPVTNYVTDFGYNSMIVHASYYGYINNTATPLDMNFSNSWIVNYSSTNPGANYSEYVVLDSSGRAIAHYTQMRA